MMVSQVQGYLTKDGRFFETKMKAELNEAEEDMRSALSGETSDPDGLVEIITRNAKKIHRYTTALAENSNAPSDPTSAVRAKRANASPKSSPSPVYKTDSSSDSPFPDQS